MALCGHPLLFCSVFEHLPLVSRQPFLVELATLPHRPWAPKPSEPSNSGFSSTKTPFLCAFCLRNPRFGAFRAQNRDFCALLPSETPIFRHFEHKIGIFVSETAIFPWFWPLSSTKSGFLCSGRQTSGIGKCKSDLRAIHRARQCAPEVPRTGGSVLGDLHERRTHQVAALSGTQHLRPGQATASSGGDMEVA